MGFKIALIVFVLLIVTLYYGIRKRKEKKADYQKQLQQVKQAIEEFINHLQDKIHGKYLNFSAYRNLYDEGVSLYDSTKRYHKDLQEYGLFFSFVEDVKFRDDHNDAFVNQEKKQYEGYFKQLDDKGFGLTDKQLNAIFTDEDATLINAGAGTGKTKTLENKIVYLHVIKKVPLQDILVITYSKSSQQDMLKRIVDSLNRAGVSVHEDALKFTVSTFHAFGKRILDQYYAQCCWSGSGEEKLIGKGFVGKKVIEEKDQMEVMELVMDRLKKDEFLQPILSKYLLYFSSPEYSVEEFETLDDYYNRVKRSYLTLIKDFKGYNVVVKSYGEVLIANFLVSNGVAVEYEPKSHFYTTDTGDRRTYKPDFYLPDYGIYIEYFGIDKNGNTAPYISAENYVHRMNQKKENHKKSGNKLIDMRYADYQDGKWYFLNKLEKELKKYGVQLQPQSQGDIIKLLKGQLSGLDNILKTFLALYKESRETIEALKEKVQTFDGLNRERNQIFLEIFSHYFKQYTDLLVEGGFMDFGDMISDAKDIIKSGAVQKKYSYILVDEFQDISEARAMLLRNLIKDHDETRLFCVGDDWQSIYRFAGSNANIFLKFENYFDYTKKITLDRTFRFNQGISDISGKFIMQNPEQTVKRLSSNNRETKDKILVLQKDGDQDHVYLSILNSIFENVFRKAPETKEISIMYLTRYSSKKYAKKHDQDFIDFLVGKYGADKHITKDNGKDISYYETSKLTYRDKKIAIKCIPLTVHKSKGLEADYVLVDYINQNDDYNFPSSFDDDPVLELLLEEKKGKFIFSEERRLFYVAITRGKNLAFLIYNKQKQSLFLKDLLAIGGECVKIVDVGGQKLSLLSDYQAPKCANCGGVLKVSQYDRIYPEFYCANYYMGCDVKYFKYDGKLYKALLCPICGNSMMLRQNSRNYSVFRGCVNYPSCRGTRYFLK
ncbi:hypothetical protein BSK20_00260 [SR1 bacterium human oral taxon HOT-345]|nr:hypothetical protein BSK20_00260 [SR1 bacterium human oral taxon HOT-345]